MPRISITGTDSHAEAMVQTVPEVCPPRSTAVHDQREEHDRRTIVSRRQSPSSSVRSSSGRRTGLPRWCSRGRRGSKSTLWAVGVELARTQGVRVLSSRPAEAERSLAHAGLGDLLEGVVDDVLPPLSPPRERALQVALLLEEVREDTVDHLRAHGLAIRDALLALSEDGPLLVAIDDVQWFDDASSSALAFALGGSPHRRVCCSPAVTPTRPPEPGSRARSTRGAWNRSPSGR